MGFIDAQTCNTPNNESGKCVSINDCKPLLDLVRKKDRTDRELQFLRDSHCGYKDRVPAVCCPQSNDCVTPERKPGTCVGLYSCKHIVNMLRAPTKDDIEYVKKTVCNGPEEQSVCCGPPPETKPKLPSPRGRCSDSLTAFPPERDSRCCGIESAAGNKIIGGKDTYIDEYPWLVVIEYIKLGETKLLCGGSLISAKYVLTAGHCVAGQILSVGTPKNVRLGEYNTTNNGPDCVEVEAGGMDCTDPIIIAPIEKTIPHPEYKPYDPQKSHDIALIRMKVSAPYTDFVRPICLPTMDYTKQPPEDFKFFVAGWGRYKQFENGTRLSSKVKQHVLLPYALKDKCQEAQRTLRGGANLVLGNGQLCAGGEAGKDSCKGDSGGPLMYATGKLFEAVGVVSFGAEHCGTMNIPGVYTYVYEYLPWIKNTIVA